jgi:hypothetical protein
LIGDFYSVNIFTQEAPGEVVAYERSHEDQRSIGGMTHHADHATQARLALGGRLIFVFLWTPSFCEKGDTLFFPQFSKVAAEAKPFFHLRKG